MSITHVARHLIYCKWDIYLEIINHVTTVLSRSLEVLQPTTKESGPNSLGLPVTVLPPGASRTLLFNGGPHPWVGKPSFFFSDGEKKTALA